MGDRQLPTPRTATDTYLAAIYGRLGELLDRFPEAPVSPPSGDAGGGEVEIREPVASPAAAEPETPPVVPDPEPEEELAPPSGPDTTGPVGDEQVEPEPADPAGTAGRDPVTEPEDPPHAAEDGEAPEPPSVRAPKKAWIAYATGQGVDAADAEAMTKQQLIDRFRG